MNIRSILLLSLAFISTASFASQKAITDEGQVVILNSNQTWQFAESTTTSSQSITLNPNKFIKSTSQNFKVKATPTTLGVYINPDVWTFSKESDSPSRLTFKSKDPSNQDLYGLMISEGIEMDIEFLTEIALENAKAAAPDVRVIKKEYRNVNGSQVLYMEMVGTLKSINFKFVGYYGSNKSGIVQLVCYSSANIVESKKKEIEEFLNGFTQS